MGKKLQNNRMLSALKHGATAGILPHEGRVWRQHLAAVRDALQPAGAVEEALVERIAVTLWRLRRVVIWEAGLLADARDHARVVPGFSGTYPVPDSPPRDRQNAAVSSLRRILQHWVSPLADSSEIVAEAHEYVASERARIANLERALAALDDPAGWTALDDDAAAASAETLIAALDEQENAALAARWEIEPKEVREVVPRAEDLPDLLELLGIERARTVLEDELRVTTLRVSRAEEALEAYHQATAERQARARPDLDELGKLQRYEAHLERMLYRALHELEALQARRQGEAAPLARLEVYGTSDLRALDE